MRRLLTTVKDWLPPKLLGAARRIHAWWTRSGCYYCGDKWPPDEGRGWSTDDITVPRMHLFRSWQEKLKKTSPLVAEWPCAKVDSISLDEHNRYLTSAYVLALAAQDKKELAVLDWGGACADYLLLANKLIPGVIFHWHCVEVLEICELGRKVNQAAIYYADESWCGAQYNLSFSSSAIQYVCDWKALANKLAGASREWLFLTRIPVVLSVSSYVFQQRAPQYRTSYSGWAFNRGELVDIMNQQDFELFQEFVLGPWMSVYGAPERPVTMGFLFRRKKSVASG